MSTRTDRISAEAVNAFRNDGTPYVWWAIYRNGNVIDQEAGGDPPGHLTDDELRAFEQELVASVREDEEA